MYGGIIGLLAFVVNLFFVEKTRVLFFQYIDYIPPVNVNSFDIGDVYVGIMGLAAGYFLPTMIVIIPAGFIYVALSIHEGSHESKSKDSKPSNRAISKNEPERSIHQDIIVSAIGITIIILTLYAFYGLFTTALKENKEAYANGVAALSMFKAGKPVDCYDQTWTGGSYDKQTISKNNGWEIVASDRSAQGVIFKQGIQDYLPSQCEASTPTEHGH